MHIEYIYMIYIYIIYIYIYIYYYVYIYILLCIYIYIDVYIYIYTYIYMCVHTHTCIHTYIYIYIHTYIYIYPYISEYHGLEAHPCNCRRYRLKLVFWSLKKQAPNAAAKLPKGRFCESQTPTPLVFAVPLMRPCWWLGSADRGISAKVPWKFCERLGESQSVFWTEWPSQPCKEQQLINSNLFWEGDSVMLAACFTRLWRSFPR